MPTSTIAHITDAVRHIILTNPQSILDIGVGYGRWGYLSREVLDAGHAKYKPEDWEVRIEGIEIFEPYILDHQRFLYNKIHIGNAFDVIDGLGEFDLIIAGDVLEHLERDKAEQLLRKIFNRAQKGFILNLPIGQEWLRDFSDHDNIHESHLSAWELSDFQGLRFSENTYTLGNQSLYSLIFFGESELAFNRCFLTMQDCLEAQDINGAAKAMDSFIEKYPEDVEPYLLKVNVLVQGKKLPESFQVFEQLFEKIPSFHDGYSIYLDLLKNSGNTLLMQEKGEQFLLRDLPDAVKNTIKAKIA